MPRRLGTGPTDEIDLEQPYDIYVSEGSGRIVIYRRAFIRGIVKLAPAKQFDSAADFVEIMQANGNSVYVRRHSIVKFCELGAKLDEEILAGIPDEPGG